MIIFKGKMKGNYNFYKENEKEMSIFKGTNHFEKKHERTKPLARLTRSKFRHVANICHHLRWHIKQVKRKGNGRTGADWEWWIYRSGNGVVYNQSIYI